MMYLADAFLVVLPVVSAQNAVSSVWEQFKQCEMNPSDDEADCFRR